MLKKKITKVSATIKKRMEAGRALRKYLTCKVCKEVDVEVQVDIAAVTCAHCVQRQVAPPEGIKQKEPGEKFPRGWALKATYIHTDGRIFERGVDTGKKYEPKKLGAEQSTQPPTKSKKVVKKEKPKKRRR